MLFKDTGIEQLFSVGCSSTRFLVSFLKQLRDKAAQLCFVSCHFYPQGLDHAHQNYILNTKKFRRVFSSLYQILKTCHLLLVVYLITDSKNHFE